MKVLVIDIGGTNVKMLASGKETPRKFPSGRELTPEQMVAGVVAATADWEYEVVSIGFPGPVMCGQPIAEPANLGPGWLGFDFEAAFHRPVRVINDAAMQALGSYQGGKMLFLGLGTGLGTRWSWMGTSKHWKLAGFTTRRRLWSITWARQGWSGKDERNGRARWKKLSSAGAALKPDDIVLGGGNVKKLKTLPSGTRAGDNANTFWAVFALARGCGQTQII